MRIYLLILALLLADCWVEARRSGGLGGGRRTSSSSSSSGFGSLFGGSKKSNPNPQSSYPKQTWSQTGTGGGTGAAGAGSYPKQTWSQSGTGTNYGQVSGGGYGGGNKQGDLSQSSPAIRRFRVHDSSKFKIKPLKGGTFGRPRTSLPPPTTKAPRSFGGGSSSIGGGGFVNPNRGFSNPNVGRSYGYYGAGGQSIFGSSMGSYNYHRSPFGGLSGSRGLAVGAGAGFIGGAVAGMAAVSMYHQYRQFQSLMYCHSNPGLCGYGYGHYGYGGRRILVNAEDCVGGCPNQAFCDYGICRCRDGYGARYGACFKSLNEYSTRQSEWDNRVKSNFNPYHGCSRHQDCRDVDMNMICSANKCACRNNMKWNEEVHECQIFVDVDCSDVNVNSTTSSSTTNNNDDKPVAAALTDATNSSLVEYEYEHNNETLFEEMEHGNSTEEEFDPDSPFNKLVNVTTLTANETLADSELTKINPNTTSPKEIKAAFCREVARTARIYAPPPERVDRVPSRGGGGIGYGASVAIIVCVILIVLGILYFIVKKCKRKSGGHKETYDYNEDAPAMGQPTNTMAFSALQNEPPPYSSNDQGGYPTVQVPYPPGPDAPYMQQGQPAYPPYPPGGPQQAPYPPGPPGQMPYPPGPGAQPPYPPGPGAQPPYPPGPGNPYPPYPAYN